jgi:hypothetical protein
MVFIREVQLYFPLREVKQNYENNFGHRSIDCILVKNDDEQLAMGKLYTHCARLSNHNNDNKN